MDEEYFWDLWEEHKEKLNRASGCFRINRRFKYSSNSCESQFEGFRWGLGISVQIS